MSAEEEEEEEDKEEDYIFNLVQYSRSIVTISVGPMYAICQGQVTVLGLYCP